MKVKFLLVLSVLAASALAASAGLTFQIQTTDHEGRRPEVRQSRLLVDAARIRMDDRDPSPQNTAIFLADAETLVHVDHGRRSFMNLDKQSIEEMAAQLDEAMAQLRESLAAMPPAQRAMMERMAGGLLGSGEASAAAKTVSVKPSSERQTLSGFPTVRHDVFSGEEKIAELWVASWKDLGIRKEDLGAFYRMASFQQDILRAFAKNPMIAKIGQTAFSNFDQVEGFPVVTRVFSGGKLIRETLLQSIARNPLPADSFQVPEGYKQQELPNQKKEQSEPAPRRGFFGR